MLEERGLCLKPKGTLCLKRRNLRLTKPEPSLVIQTTIALTSPMITSQIIFSFIGGYCAEEINLKGDPHKLKKQNNSILKVMVEQVICVMVENN